MKKLLKKLAILGLMGVFVVPSQAFAAIAFSNAVSGLSGSNADQSGGSGTNRLMIAIVAEYNGTGDPGAPTFGGVSMTNVVSKVQGASSTWGYVLVAPASSGTFVCPGGSICSYEVLTGAKQSTTVDATGSGGIATGTVLSSSATVVTTGSWVVTGAMFNNAGTITGDSNTVIQASSGAYQIADTNASKSAGSVTQTLTSTVSQTSGASIVQIAIAPAAADTSITSDLVLFGDW